MTKKKEKKSFQGQVIDQLINQPEKTPDLPGFNAGFNLITTERKSGRLQLLVYPSVLDGLNRISKMTGITRNDLVNQVLKNWLSQVDQ